MSAPRIYVTHPLTGEFIGTSVADPDPLVAGGWLVPANAYLDGPLTDAGVGRVWVRVGFEWEARADCRGVLYRKEDGAAVDFQALGEIPEGLTPAPFPGAGYCWGASGWELSEAALLSAAESAAKNRLIELMNSAALVVTPLQSAVDVGVATPEEVGRFDLWRDYIVALGLVSVQPGYPLDVNWPVAPAE